MTLLDIRNLHVTFDTAAGPAHAVRGVDLQLARGEILGVVGESGSGKSALFLAALGLAGTRARVSGQALFDGADLIGLSDRALSRLRGHRLSMVFQDPASSLNPVRSIGHQLREAIRLNAGGALGAERPTPEALLAEVGLSDPQRQLRAYPHQLSGGQNQRAMIAMMLAGNPDLLIADEPTTALDVTVQAQILDLLQDISRARGMSVVLISHDLGVVAQICDRIAVMYGGMIVESGPVGQVFDAPAHPYMQGLMAARPNGSGRLQPIGGTVPSPLDSAPGCAFAPRCARRSARCSTEAPPRVGERRWWRCFHPVLDVADDESVHEVVRL